MIVARFAAAILLFGAALSAAAQSRSNVLDVGSDPRGEPELTICSQNLANYGLVRDVKMRVPGTSSESFDAKEAALVKRFADARCDIIAVQEVLGRDEGTARQALEKLAIRMRKTTHRFFEAIVGPSNDPMLRNGYLYAKDRADLATRVSYARVELPKLAPEEKPRLFVRGPLEAQFLVKARGDSPAKTVTLVTFHFKSKRGGGGDPAHLEWETYRMEMAEAVRRVVLNRHIKSLASGDTVLALMGDRNSNFDAASAKILEGSLDLSKFQGEGVCRLSKRGVPLCQAEQQLPQRFFSVLTGDPQTKIQPGTFQMKNEFSWLDDIIMPSESLRTAWGGYDTPGDYASGVLYEPKKASDHALVYVRLNW